MPAIDFKEIPAANAGGGTQDTFELFARDFLKNAGLHVEQSPGRGSDGGRDLVVIERRTGVAGETLFRWLVSCKHYAHSGKAVGVDDELNVGDRVAAAKANGFWGFYSSLPSAGLITRLAELRTQFEHTFSDAETIESDLLKTKDGHLLFKRYFPISFKQWIGANPSKPDLLIDHRALTCQHCGKDLLDQKLLGLGLVIWWQASKADKDGRTPVKNLYWCCKGACDHALKTKFKDPLFLDLSEELSVYTIPTLYIRTVTSLLFYINDGNRLDQEAIDRLGELLTITFHSVSRGLTPKEEELVKLHQEVGMA